MVPTHASGTRTTRIRAGLRQLTIRVIERFEESIYIVVAVLLVVAAVFVLITAAAEAISEFQRSFVPINVVLNVLGNGLLLFMVAELLHTVRITLREHGLAAEPFLIVGLIAGIRRVLVLTAQSESGFNWNQEGIQLVILIGLILVMAVAILVWRRSERLATAQDRAER